MGAARDHDDVCARQGGARFAEVSGGKQAATAEGICRVYQDDVHIARELQVLKAVVEDEPIHAALREFPALFVAICADAELDAIAEACLEHADFVAGGNDGVRCGGLGIIA